MSRPAALAALTVLISLAACSRRPPPDFRPDPALLAQIRSIDMFTDGRACPGQTIRASYQARLEDGRVIPFADRYDRRNPPDLHVMFLTRYSPNAIALQNGNWSASPDALASVMNGFTLRASLRERPDVAVEERVIPDYMCSNQVYAFQGPDGSRGQPGGNGPDITVRLVIAESPFYRRLLIAQVRVEQSPPFYVMADADRVPPADWLVIVTRGGRGGRGTDGQRGAAGADGQRGCPGTAGGTGGAGGAGGAGAPGGRGGRITVYVPQEEPFIAGLVDGYSDGGPGGGGGRGGEGGAGGRGGPAETGGDRRCQPGADGAQGPRGGNGSDGPDGPSGPRMQTVTLPQRDVFGLRPPYELEALLSYGHGGER